MDKFKTIVILSLLVLCNTLTIKALPDNKSINYLSDDNDIKQAKLSHLLKEITAKGLNNKINSRFLNTDSTQSKKHEADISYNKAVSQRKIGKHKEAINLLVKSFNIYQNLNFKNETGNCLFQMAVIQKQLGMLKSSLDYASSALSIYKETNNHDKEAETYNLIGNIYENLNDYNAAKIFYKKEIETIQKNNLKEIDGNTYIKLAKINSIIGNNNQAILCITKGIEAADSCDNESQKAEMYCNTGDILLKKRKYDEALSYFLKAYNIIKIDSNPYDLTCVEISIAQCYLNTKKYSECINYSKSAIERSEKNEYRHELIDAYDLLSSAYSQLDDFENAYKAKQKQQEYSNKLYEEGLEDNLQLLKTKIEFHEIKSENKFLKQKNKIGDIENSNNVFLRKFLIYILLITFLLLILLFHQLYERRLKNKKLASLNLKLTEVNVQLKLNEKELKDINNTKDKFFSIVSHDLRNPLATMISFVRLLRRDYDTMSKEEKEELITEFSNMVNNTLDLLENLLMWSRSQTGSLKYSFKDLSAKEIITYNVNSSIPNAKAKDISMNADIPEKDIIVHADPNMINTVMRNLIINAIKFTKANGNISSGYFEKDEKCIMFVKDTGIGIDKENLEKLFKLASGNVRTGTANEKGSGLGLSLCKDFVEKNNGEIWAESEVNKGTTFYFSLPIASEASSETEIAS